MKAELIPSDGGDPIPITKDVTVMGRREYCDVQIDHPSLSKRHCVLVKTDGLLVIRDLATTNGTKVKGQKIRWAALLPDDKISLGSIKFRVYLGPDHVPSPAEVAAKVQNGFVPPTPYPGVPSPSPAPPNPQAQTKPVAPPDDDDDVDIPLIMTGGTWRDVVGPDSAEIPDMIEFD